MTVKMMTGKQVNFVRQLLKEKLILKENWEEIIAELDLDISKEEELYHLNVEQASGLIRMLIQMPDK